MESNSLEAIYALMNKQKKKKKALREGMYLGLRKMGGKVVQGGIFALWLSRDNFLLSQESLCPLLFSSHPRRPHMLSSRWAVSPKNSPPKL
jgi:hypothetical protein